MRKKATDVETASASGDADRNLRESTRARLFIRTDFPGELEHYITWARLVVSPLRCRKHYSTLAVIPSGKALEMEPQGGAGEPAKAHLPFNDFVTNSKSIINCSPFLRYLIREK